MALLLPAYLNASSRTFSSTYTRSPNSGWDEMRKIVLPVLLLASSAAAVFPARADVITCDHLKTALVAGASEHRLQTPVALSTKLAST
jgi:hypothetical protein